jgi:hypothetical protein
MTGWTTRGGHMRVLHASVLVSAGHAAPLWVAGARIGRVADRVPPPHGAEQSDQPDQPPTTQAVGQAAVAQARVATVASQGTPPWAAGVRTARVRFWTPPPHATGHSDHSDHALRTQSTAKKKKKRKKINKKKTIKIYSNNINNNNNNNNKINDDPKHTQHNMKRTSQHI